ncbi:unnamed protein product [Rotaria sp. Silwood1]|nr:unnamed protein product [Rotaria sp. Silwood1]
MERLSVQLMDLPDELLIIIFKKLNNIDVLCSLIDVNMRFNKIICDQIFTSYLTLFQRSSDDVICPLNDRIIDRFCLQILPQIHYKIKWLNIESSSMKHILCIVDYPNLNGLGLYNIEEETFKRLFIDEIALTRIYKNQIYKLIITVANNTNEISMKDLIITIYMYVFTVFTNLHYLNFCSFSNINPHYLSFDRKSPNFFSSTLTELYINLENFEDCLYLLNGHFNQLRIFYVTIRFIDRSFMVINNEEELPNLRCFSLTCDDSTYYYMDLIVPLLHRMLNLEELILYLVLNSTEKFIDGDNLTKNIINHVSRLNKFIFNIRSVIYALYESCLPLKEQIQQTFINFINKPIITCVDYFPSIKKGHCHMYSYPYTMTYYIHITNNFPGGLFKCVREITLFDERPFEHQFFIRIAQAFPYLKILSVNNWTAQKYKQCRKSNDDNQDSSIANYPHLIQLSLLYVHVDYVEQFLDNTKTFISNNISFSVNYSVLRQATHNFTRNEMRINCSKLSDIHIFEKFYYSEHFKAYFPNIKTL